MNFFTLEGGYLAIALFILAVTAFVTTRPFMTKGAFTKGMSLITILLAGAIGSHYYLTAQRMAEVEKAFSEGKNIICESRAIRKVSQTVTVNQEQNWKLANGIFTSSNYERGFHSARCVVELK
jgi:hypothetical protein